MQVNKTRVLTGITTSGTPHLGNYSGAIRPAIKASEQSDVDAFFFLADYHALIKCDDPERVCRSRLEIAATWLAAGLNPQRVTFYRQSDVPEIPELSWILTCVTPKGLMNRAHAYKASVDINLAKGADIDDGVTMGLYSYPILMAADILMFNAHLVPVGKDQIQHLEMTRDLAQRFNSHYGQGRDYFVLPEVLIDENVDTLPGLDGRKMSKSYNNTIPLFEGSNKDLKTAISRIQTDSLLHGEAKDPDNSHLVTIYRAFASPEQARLFSQELINGMGWGDAKNYLYDHLSQIIEPMRERYNELMSQPAKIEEILQAGACKARAEAKPFLREIRQAVGLRNSVRVTAANHSKQAKPAKKSAKGARFVSFRNAEGKFQFRLLAANGRGILCSIAMDNPKEAGNLVQEIQKMDINQSVQVTDNGFIIKINNKIAAYSVDAEDPSAWQQLLADSLKMLNS